MPVRHRRGVEVRLYSFLSLVLVGVSGQCHALPPLTLGRSPSAYWSGGWGWLRTGLDGYGEEKISFPQQ